MHFKNCEEGNEEENQKHTMNNPNYEKFEGNGPFMQNPPHISKKQLGEDSEDLTPLAGSALPTGYETPSPLAQQYQLYCDSSHARLTQDLVLQPQQGVFLTPLQPTNEPDHLGFSIFTMLCCCLPIGMAALVYSIKTREANRIGNGTAAQKFSKRAHSLARTAFKVGIVILIGNFILVCIYELKHLAATMKSLRQKAMDP